MDRGVIADNARRLLHDAELLYSHQRYASAAALAIFSIEEVGKVIEDVVWGLKEQRPNWHKRKHYNVGRLLTAQICSHVIGKNVTLPMSGDDILDIDCELAELLISPNEATEARGRALGRLLFFRSEGRVDEKALLRVGRLADLLMSGRLESIRSKCLYVDIGRDALTDTHSVADDMLLIARAATAMCPPKDADKHVERPDLLN